MLHGFFFYSVFSTCLCLNQDILENESINLDWMFRYSLINDIVKVCAGQAEPAGNWTVKQKGKKNARLCGSFII